MEQAKNLKPGCIVSVPMCAAYMTVERIEGDNAIMMPDDYFNEYHIEERTIPLTECYGITITQDIDMGGNEWGIQHTGTLPEHYVLHEMQAAGVITKAEMIPPSPQEPEWMQKFMEAFNVHSQPFDTTGTDEWKTHPFRCDICEYNWVALYPASCSEIACPNCGRTHIV